MLTKRVCTCSATKVKENLRRLQEEGPKAFLRFIDAMPVGQTQKAWESLVKRIWLYDRESGVGHGRDK